MFASGFKKYAEPITRVAAGHMTSFALTKKGDVYSWGSNRFGALGLGDGAQLSEDVFQPTLVTGEHTRLLDRHTDQELSC
jgi:alpha-tubulin suppressor-like RCC1 family protein